MTSGPRSAPFRTRNMTAGPIYRQLLLFALPLLAGSLIQQLYNTVDLIFLGRFVGVEASAAVGASSMLVTCIVGFFTGMNAGSMVVSSQLFGAEDWRGLDKAIHTAAAVSLWGGLVFMTFGLILSPSFLRWMSTPPAIMEQASDYIRLYLLSLVPIVAYNVGSGILRGLGDSRSPMLCQLAGGLLNVAADALCICVLDWGVRGAALATLLSQTVAALLVVRRLWELDERYRLRWGKIRLFGDMAARLFRVGVPAGVQATAITFSNLFVQTRINRLGVDAIAAFTAYFKVEMFLYVPILALGQAVAAFTGQNIGAGRFDRVREGGKDGLILGICLTALVSALMLLFAPFAFALFTTDEGVDEIGVGLARLAFPFYFLYVLVEVLGSVIRGTGRSLPPMLIILFSMCFVRPFLLDVLLSRWPMPEGVVGVYPATWFCAALGMAIYYRWGPLRWMEAQTKNKGGH